MKPLGLLGLAIGLVVLVAACGGNSDTTPEPATPTAKPTTGATSIPVTEGQRLFTANGCGACHGAQGEGTGIAPALSGHTVGQVKRQARAPLGIMPVFSPSTVSNEDLSLIAEYVESLEGDHGHMRVSDPGAALSQHHWMTLFALEDDSATDGIHHIDHIITQVTGQHLSQMEQAKTDAEDGNLHDAIHIIENMLAGVQVADLTPSEMHASLARSSVMIDDIAGTLHHLDHFMERMSGDEAVANQVTEIRELLESGNVSDAAHELEELTGTAHEEEHEEPVHSH
ncbi:MAG: cytochrome c [Chloroflexi bacterium]|nr:cytochrome c [Chloroflexota bacterium]